MVSTTNMLEFIRMSTIETDPQSRQLWSVGGHYKGFYRIHNTHYTLHVYFKCLHSTLHVYRFKTNMLISLLFF
jgi:hypothetical protein